MTSALGCVDKEMFTCENAVIISTRYTELGQVINYHFSMSLKGRLAKIQKLTVSYITELTATVGAKVACSCLHS